MEKAKCPCCGEIRKIIPTAHTLNEYPSEIIRCYDYFCTMCGQTWNYYENLVISSAYNGDIAKED